MKLIGFIRRRSDLDFEAFSRHWRTTHRMHAEKLRPWLNGYVQAHYRPGPLPGVQRPADGSPILWVDGPETMLALASSEECRSGAIPDEALFMEGASSGLAVEPVVVLPATGTAAVTLMLFAHGRPGTPRATLEGDWLCPTRYACSRTVNHAVAGQDIDPAFAFDAIEEIGWPDEATFRADWASSRSPGKLPWLKPAGFKAALVNRIEVFAPPD